MNRKLIVEAIEKYHVDRLDLNGIVTLRSAIKYLSDTNLLAFAIDLGIDTDAILTQEAK